MGAHRTGEEVIQFLAGFALAQEQAAGRDTVTIPAIKAPGGTALPPGTTTADAIDILRAIEVAQAAASDTITLPAVAQPAGTPGDAPAARAGFTGGASLEKAGRATTLPPGGARPALSPGGTALLPDTGDAVPSPDAGPGRAAHTGSPNPPARPGPAHARRGRLDWRRPLTGHWPLAAILAAQAGLSLRLVWSNTAFTDEALYLWAGHLEWAHWLHGTPVPDFATYFSGAPVIYPPLGALADNVGGLAGARVLSLFFMLGATCLLYGTTKKLFGYRSAIFASALFAAVGPTADLGAFATYDAMAIFLLALASWLAVRAGGRLGELWLIAAAVAMVAADATKYASGLWNPVIVALAVLSTAGVRRAGLARGIRFCCYAVIAAVPALILGGGNDYVHGLLFTTLARSGTGNSVQTVLWTAATYIGVLALLAIAGLWLNWHAGTRLRLLSAALAVALILAPADEAHIGTIQSLYKHVIFGAWFGAMLAGYALARAMEVNHIKGWRIGAAASVFVALIGSGQGASMFGYWPSSAGAVALALKDTMAAHGSMLTAEANIAKYDIITQHLPVNPDSVISYVDHGGLASSPVALIRKRDVSVVELDLYASAPGMDGDSAMLAALPASGYRLSTRMSWTDAYTHGWFEIWQRIGR